MIEVSRQDIIPDYLLDYPAADKFLKLPVEPYMDLLGIQPLPSQVAIINAILSTDSSVQQFPDVREKLI